MESMKSFFNRNTIASKTIVITVLTFLMLIPIDMVRSLVMERQGNKNAEQTEMGWKWGGKQQLTGPVLVVPYVKSGNNVDMAYFLPDEYNVNGDIVPEERTRGIQKVLNYQSKMAVNGQFQFPDIEKLGIKASQVLWDDCYLALGISNLQGIKNKIVFNVNGKPREIISGELQNGVIKSGLKIKKQLDPNTRNVSKFDFDLLLNGMEGLYFLPVGKQTSIHLTSSWKSAYYTGDFVATEKADVKDGIDAKWDIFDYNRNFVPMWTGENEDFNKSVIGLKLQLPIDHYEKTLRAVKYAILFIVLTFLVFFLVELLGKKRIHFVQYLLVSLALVLFYTLLLAFSEHIGFNWSYIVSAFAIIILITAYSHSIFKEKKQTVLMGVFLVILYTYLYIVLQQEDMALLLGAIGLFIALAAVMFALRKVNWYENKENDDVLPPPYVPDDVSDNE